MENENMQRPVIINEARLTEGQRRYWMSERFMKNMIARKIDVIDPFRTNIRELRKRIAVQAPELIGKKIYRASTGGSYGKSAQVATL